MSQDFGGQGTPGGGEFDEVRRRMGGVQQRPGATPLPPGSPNPRPPGGAVSTASPVQQSSPGVGVAPNPYDRPISMMAQGPTPQGGTDVAGPRPASGPSQMEMTGKPAGGAFPTQPAVKPGAQIGPAPAQPAATRPSQTEMTGKPAGGQFSPPTPQNPSPNGPSRAQPGAAIKPVVGAPQGGGNQQPNWGLPQAASRFQRAERMPQSNMPQPAAPANPYDSPVGKPAYGAGGAPQGQPQAGTGWGMSQPMPAMPPPQQPQGGPGQPRRSVYGDQPGGGGGVSV